MESPIQSEVDIQRKYYAETSQQYERLHINERDEHFLALNFMLAALDFYEIKSILDVGSGTGRALAYIKSKRPELQVIGIEPVKELREVGYRQNLSTEELIDGDATQLNFYEGQFDLVCAFGVLHHIRKPEMVVSEMLRVARKSIFISDANNFGQGSMFTRSIKQIINAMRLWEFADFIKTKGKGYTISEGDGLAYSYSVFNNYSLIKKQCNHIHMFNTQGEGFNFYKTVSHVALLGVKK